MTVHGAKGLEAPIVFLPDTCMTPRPQGPRIFPLPRAGEPPDEVPHLVWAPAGHSDLGVLADSKAALSQAEREEHHRLLYVAMTRASDRLYVCGWQGLRKREENCWYDLVNDGLAGHLTEIAGADGVTVRRMESAQEKPVESSEAKSKLAEAAPLPDWALKRCHARAHAPAILPRHGSRLAKTPLVEQPPLGPLALGDRHRFARGRLVHALLQHLPEVEAREPGTGGARLRRRARRRACRRSERRDRRRDAWPSSGTRVSRRCSSREASPKCRSWRRSAKAKTPSRSKARSTGWPSSTAELHDSRLQDQPPAA